MRDYINVFWKASCISVDSKTANLSGSSLIFSLKWFYFQTQLVFFLWNILKILSVANTLWDFKVHPSFILALLGIHYSSCILVSMERKPQRSHLMHWKKILFRTLEHLKCYTEHFLAKSVYLCVPLDYFCLIFTFFFFRIT